MRLRTNHNETRDPIGLGANGFGGFPGARRAEKTVVCVEFLRQCRPTNTLGRRSPWSSSLKHVAEHGARQNERGGYVSNGALIVAALAAGILVRPHRYRPNATQDIDRADEATLKDAVLGLSG